MAHAFFGGVHPKDMKAMSCDKAIEVFPAPKQVVIPMSQHIGAPCKPLVKKGDTVTVGQKIGDNAGMCVPVHASVSGTVLAVEPRPYTGGTDVMSVVIENDFQDTLCPEIAPRQSIESLSSDELTGIIHEAGIAGMGGAQFPTHVKISSGIGKVDTIIVNSAECEPYITADDRLMREMPEKVIAGLNVIKKIFGLDKAYIGIEDNKPQAAAALNAAKSDADGIEVCVLHTRYPQGAEKQLIQAVTDRQVPPGGLPASVGCAVFNVATVKAVYDAVYLGMPLVKRVVTVTGSAMKDTRNYMTPIGTPFQALVDAAGGFATDPYKVLTGGPMMGIAQHTLTVPVIKGTNAVTCFSQQDNIEVANPHCIRCGKCVGVCPMHLMPLMMFRSERKGDVENLDALHILDCIECGSCAYTCPAGIHLVQSFKIAKQKLKDAQAAAKA
ncbi:MAG: electron transport complex subunit RsxC [Oscillospiraceae bacterium]|nr:electron transport complex subunit RsxC [Oscillospiraceae bacterium]